MLLSLVAVSTVLTMGVVGSQPKVVYGQDGRLDEFRNTTANIRHLVPAPIKTDPDRKKKEPIHLSWMVHRNRKTAHGASYEPNKPFFFEDENTRL